MTDPGKGAKFLTPEEFLCDAVETNNKVCQEMGLDEGDTLKVLYSVASSAGQTPYRT